MIIKTKAPVRIDFAGGWTDVAEFTAQSRGVVVNAALDLHVHAEFRVGGDTIRLVSEDLLERVVVSNLSDLEYDGRLDLHKAAINMLPVTGGIEILTRSGVPHGSGLGASGSLAVALLAGLAVQREEALEPEQLAEMGYELEARELGLLGGKQDQYAAAVGGVNEFSFEAEDVSARSLAIDDAGLRELESHLSLVYTSQSHFSSGTHEEVWKAYRNGDGAVRDALYRIRDIAASVKDVIEAGEWESLGRLMGATWEQQKLLHPTISTDAIEAIQRACTEAGAWALKATGAGAGGCVLVAGPAQRKPDIESAALKAGAELLPCAILRNGVQVVKEGEGVDEE